MEDQKWSILSKIFDYQIVAVIRGDTHEQAEKVAIGAFEGGITCLEITYTVPKASSLIESLSKDYGERALIGAGTVLDATTASLAISYGASFIVSPHFDKAIAKICNLYRVPYLPGCYTVTEMITALKYGADIIKVFPGNTVSPSFLKSIQGPLPQANLMPSGGVTEKNAKEWIDQGAVALSVGSILYKNDLEEIKENAANIINTLKNSPA